MRRECKLCPQSAREDLINAEDMFKRGRCFRAAFFCSTRCRKCIKSSFFVVRREEPPHIHTVTELYHYLKEGNYSLPKEVEEQVIHSQ
ncbi:MAG: HEPN domain-containing protein [Candidatus Asgardarchaeia archaeon]